MGAPAARIELLSRPSTAIAEVARRQCPRGAGAAAAIVGRAARQGVFAPEQEALGPRAVGAWRDAFALTLPELVETVGGTAGEWAADAAGDSTGERAGDSTGERATVPGVIKVVLRLADGETVECVRLPMGRGREALCVSSQVGCARGCTFCETGLGGLRRNLGVHEIVGQVVAVRARLGWRPRTIVFQGMGEPLDNADALLDALAVLTDRRGLAFARDRLTVCTVGHVDGIRRLASLGWKRLNLSLSLNASNDAQRAELMPIAKRWPLAEVQRALVDYRQRKNLALGVHWCLLPGINDTRADARGIAEFCAPLGRVWVHLIPYNPGSAPVARRPSEEEVARFVGWLREAGVAVRRRVTKGDRVMAACGQLGGGRG